MKNIDIAFIIKMNISCYLDLILSTVFVKCQMKMYSSEGKEKFAAGQHEVAAS